MTLLTSLALVSSPAAAWERKKEGGRMREKEGQSWGQPGSCQPADTVQGTQKES